jgi:transposase InsO family protein
LADLGLREVPAPSTVTEALRREVLIDRAEAARHKPFIRFERDAPNDLWQFDFKGHFANGAGRCHPLTVLDDHSRYSLGILACACETLAEVQRQMTGLFRQYGRPGAILCDKGSPWGAAGHAGLRPNQRPAFEVRLMRLGMATMHGRPRHPQTQGKEERFHRTLDVEVLQGRHFADLAESQRAFDRWHPIYNEQRPHEVLGLAVPASRYRPSPPAFPERLPEPEYGEGDKIRRMGVQGHVQWQGHKLPLSLAFAGMDVALRPTATDGVWSPHFMRFNREWIDTAGPKAILKPSGMSPNTRQPCLRSKQRPQTPFLIRRYSTRHRAPAPTETAA